VGGRGGGSSKKKKMEEEGIKEEGGSEGERGGREGVSEGREEVDQYIASARQAAENQYASRALKIYDEYAKVRRGMYSIRFDGGASSRERSSQFQSTPHETNTPLVTSF
jgi:hypothetical protein